MIRWGATFLSMVMMLGLWADDAQSKEDMYSTAHLKEIATGLSQIRARALANTLQKSDADKGIPEDQTYRTKEGLYFVYTVHFAIEKEKGPMYLHMVSFSMDGNYTPMAYRRTFMAYFHDLLGFDAVESFAMPSDRVTKLGCMLSTKQHRKLVKKKIAAPRGKKLKRMLTGCMVQGGKNKRPRQGKWDIPRGKMCKI